MQYDNFVIFKKLCAINEIMINADGNKFIDINEEEMYKII